jgi:hypothetical protein
MISLHKILRSPSNIYIDLVTQQASYIVFTDGSKCYAKNGTTGMIEYFDADATKVINYAISKASDVVFVKYGIYEIRSSINLKSGVKLVSEGAVLKAVGKGFHVIRIAGSNVNPITDVEVRGFEIDLNNLEGVTKDIISYGVYIALARRVKVADLYIHDETNDSTRGGVGGILIYNPLGILNYTNYDIWVVNNYVKMRGVRQSPPIEVYDTQRYFEYGNVWWGSDPDVQQVPDKRGLHQVANIRDAIIRGNYFYRGHHNAILFWDSSSAGRHSENVVIADNIFIEPQDDHIDLNYDSKITIVGNIFIHGSASLGWVTPEDNCEDIVITGNYFFGDGYIHVSNSRRVTISGNVFYATRFLRNYIRISNGLEVTISGNTMFNTAGVFVEGASKNILISGNRMVQAGGNPLYILQGSSAQNVFMIGNMLDINPDLGGSYINIMEVRSSQARNIIAQFNMRGASGRMYGARLRTDIDPNIDPATQNIIDAPNNILLEYPRAQIRSSGVATISAGSTRVTVSHGLRQAPSKVLITPLGQPPGKIWVENITPTSFNIVTDTAPTSNLNVAWYAEV